MILGPVSYLDCIIFCIFLAPQLLWHVGLFETIQVVWKALPFLVTELPAQFIHDRYVTDPKDQRLFIRQASPFEDIVVRCVRYAFANIPPNVGRVFFSKWVALPWLRWRMLRHGYVRSPVTWREHSGEDFRGVWASADPAATHDVILYYAHGGGFSMGSTYFYLEFLLTWLSVMKEEGYKNPAIFGLDYTLVPDQTFPKQLEEMVAGYEHVLGMASDPSIVCIAGDSAGGTLVLSLLLHIAKPFRAPRGVKAKGNSRHLVKPGMAVLISPWTTLHSPRYRNRPDDFLDAETLQLYATQYAGGDDMAADEVLSPGLCDPGWWARASPSKGWFIIFGAGEVFAPEIVEFVQTKLPTEGVHKPSVHRQLAAIHAWPVVSLFLKDSTARRLDGLRMIVSQMTRRIVP